MVASTNHLDQLDPGLASRPSRFDRKYLFPLPSTEERVLYCDYWRNKLAAKPSIKFPKKLCPAIAGITEDFSFAYLKEAFVATLLAIAGNRSEDETRGGGDDEGGNLDDYELWREMKKQVKLLREDMDTKARESPWQSGWIEDVSWKGFDEGGEFNGASASPATSQLPFRIKNDPSEMGKRQQIPRHAGMVLDLGARQVPLMSATGEFVPNHSGAVAGVGEL